MERGERVEAARRSLEGLSVGDALGKAFFVGRSRAEVELICERELPPAPWLFTDDTVMACALVDVLAQHGEVDQDALAAAFAERFAAESERGYGAVAYWLLFQLGLGRGWRELTQEIFRGEGSKGNGGAMRVAPLGMFFADDLERVVEQARRSAQVTHHHPEGQAGAIAVAVAAAVWGQDADRLRRVSDLVPDGPTRVGLLRAQALGACSAVEAANQLGDGALVLAEDTVPFALWCAARAPVDFEEALWTALAGLTNPDSDRDTVLAIVGGVVGARAPIPQAWLQAREPLPGPEQPRD